MINLMQRSRDAKPKQIILPDFIIIGGMKCGTTSLYYYLNSHPEISMSTEKELDFFISQKNWKKGIEWYCSQFTGEAKIYGEASPNYTNYPKTAETAKLIYETIPHAKLIYLVRDPIERLISQYVHRYAAGKENRTLTEALANFEANPKRRYINRSRYYYQLEQYLPYFPPQQILVVSTEELYCFPQKTLKTVFKFLEIADKTDCINFQRKLHKSVFKRRKTNWGNKISNVPVMQSIEYLPFSLREKIKKVIYFPFSTPVKKPTLDLELRSRLIDYFKEDVDQLREYTKKDFSEWCL